MTRLLLLSLFFAFSAKNNPLLSQAKINVDSLLAANDKYVKEDTVKVKMLILLCTGLYDKKKHKEGLVYSEQALAIAEKFTPTALKADALYYKARFLDVTGRSTEALPLAEASLKLYETSQVTKKIIATHHLLGLIYGGLVEPEKAKKQYEQMLALLEQPGDIKNKVIAFNGLGSAYSSLNNSVKAVEYYEKSLELAEKSKDLEGQSIALGNLSTLYRRVGNFLKALEYVQKSLRIDESANDFYYITYDYADLGNIYLQLNEQDKALDYFKKGLALTLKTGDESNEVFFHERIGICYATQKKYTEAVAQIEKSIAINKKNGNEKRANGNLLSLGTVFGEMSRMVDAHRCFQEVLIESRKSGREKYVGKAAINLAHLYAITPDSLIVKMGINPAERHAKGIALATEGVAITTKIGERADKAEGLQALSALYERDKAYTLAYDTYKKYIALKDSLSGDEVKTQITRKEIQYEYDKKEIALKYDQQLTAGQLEKERLLTFQQGQALSLSQQNLTLNRQTLTLKEQALALSNKQKDLTHLAYLKEQAEKQEKMQELSLSEARGKGAALSLSLKNLELSAQQKQNLYLGLFSLVLLSGFGALLYFYNTLKKQKNIIAQQNELNEHTIAILSHDIKEPLLGVKLMLKKLNKDDPFVAQASQSLENQVNAVNGILNNLLKIKKLGLSKKDKNAKANAKSVVQNVIQELNVAIQSKDLTIQNELPDELMLPIAPEKLQIIVNNLLANAVKYSFVKQNIRIFQEGNGFSIQDFGIGLSPEQRSKLMREVTISKQGTNAERGNGLGLFLVGAVLQGEQIKVFFDSPKVGGTIAKVLG